MQVRVKPNSIDVHFLGFSMTSKKVIVMYKIIIVVFRNWQRHGKHKIQKCTEKTFRRLK